MCINRLHVDVERLTRGRVDGDLRCFPVAVLAPVPGSPRVAQLSLGCLTRRRGIQKRSRSCLADHKNRPAAADSRKASLAPQPFRQIHGLTKRPISSTNCSHNLNGTSATRYPKIMAQSWRPAARYNRLALAGWSEAIPRYNDAFRAPLATGRPVINFGRLDELRASATPYSWVMKL